MMPALMEMAMVWVLTVSLIFLPNINLLFFMKKNYSVIFFFFASIILFGILYGCEKDYVAPEQPVSKSFSEEFDTVANLYNKGWVFVNNSKPQGAATWQQGVWASGKLGPDGFPAYSYKASGDEYIFAGYATAGGVNGSTISSWMLTPAFEMKNGDKFSFYTRTISGTANPDRLQVRINLTDNSANVGNDSSSVGKFTTLLKDINPGLTTTGYPTTWTKYEIILSGLPAPLKRRIGFRYYV